MIVTARASGVRPSEARLRKLRRPELALLVLLALYSVLPLCELLVHAARHHLVISGADGPLPGDQFQYMSWIRQFGTGLLAANDLDTAPSRHVFVQPMFLVSGLLWRLGLSVQLAYLLWKPVALVALFCGFRAYVARFISSPGRQLAGLASAVFYAAPATPLVMWLSLGSAPVRSRILAGGTELLPAAELWGYLPTAISVGLTPLYLLGVERLVEVPASGSARRVRLTLVSACGAAVSWLHPWQGQVMLLTLVAGVALGRFARRYAVLLLPAAAALAPLLYYYVLSHADSAWRLAQRVNTHSGHASAWAVALAVAPLAVPAAFGLRATTVGFGERMLRAWPLAGIVVWAALSPSFPNHALEGLSLPLAVLAVRGLARLRHHGATALAAFALLVTVPGCLYQLESMRTTMNSNQQAFYLRPGERDALAYLARLHTRGAVLPTPFLGPLVPALTGRKTWIGHPSWTRNFDQRVGAADALFAGVLARPAAIRLVRSSGATFMLDDCAHQAGALRAMRPLIRGVHRFGCAGVYVLGAPVAARHRRDPIPGSPTSRFGVPRSSAASQPLS